MGLGEMRLGEMLPNRFDMLRICIGFQVSRSMWPSKSHFDIGYVPQTDTGSLYRAVDSTRTYTYSRWSDGLELTARDLACDIDSFKQFFKTILFSLYWCDERIKGYFNHIRAI